MGNPPMGLDFFEGEMGVVLLKFDGVDLGMTLDNTSLERLADIKDIKFAQRGTQPSDLVPTGQGWKLTTKLGETTLARLAKLTQGTTVINHSAKLAQDLYRGAYDNFARRLEIVRCDSDGVASTRAEDRVVFYKAFPKVTGAIGGPMGPDQQRGTDVEFTMLYDRGRCAFGFSGRASSVGL